jgi:hypothetical protein
MLIETHLEGNASDGECLTPLPGAGGGCVRHPAGERDRRRNDCRGGGGGPSCSQRGYLAMIWCTAFVSAKAWSKGRNHMLRPNITPVAPEAM